MKDVFAGMLFGWMIAMILIAAPFSDTSKYRAALKECEQTLPRDQHCKVVGVPK
jgi:hypothetical protein